jgi:hypothetical protein
MLRPGKNHRMPDESVAALVPVWNPGQVALHFFLKLFGVNFIPRSIEFANDAYL